MSTCDETNEDGQVCTLETMEIDGETTHYGPSHLDETTQTGWFDDNLPEPPPPPVKEPDPPGEL